MCVYCSYMYIFMMPWIGGANFFERSKGLEKREGSKEWCNYIRISKNNIYNQKGNLGQKWNRRKNILCWQHLYCHLSQISSPLLIQFVSKTEREKLSCVIVEKKHLKVSYQKCTRRAENKAHLVESMPHKQKALRLIWSTTLRRFAAMHLHL